MIEHRREKQFMRSLINDLQLDINWLDTVTNSARARISNIDSAVIAITRQQTNEIPVAIYQQLRKGTIQIVFFSNDGTMTQLKYSGGMRLIRQRDVVDSIEVYARQMRRMEMRREITHQIAKGYTDILNKAFAGEDIVHFTYDSTYILSSPGLQTIELVSSYKNELINQCIAVRQRTVNDTTVNLSVRTSAARLIDFINKKYAVK
jgi:hypothetical protein